MSDLSSILNDLNNLLSSLNLPIVTLDTDLRIRRFTPVAGKIMNLAPADVGRPIGDLQLGIHLPELGRLAGEVIESGQDLEREVQGPEGRSYSLRLRPYRTHHNKIDGAVVILVDIHDVKSALGELSGRLLRAQDEERRRLARDLHDSTAQNLAGAVLYLSRVEEEAAALSPAARQALRDGLWAIEQAGEEVRTTSYLLHPPLLDQKGLASALRLYVQGFEQQSGVRVKLDVPEDLPRLPSEIEITLFRIVEESLSTVHRHSGSVTATLSVGIDSGEVRLKWSDLGKGTAAPRVGSPRNDSKLGAGILGIQERVKQLGGKLEVGSTDDGTTLAVSLPLRIEP